MYDWIAPPALDAPIHHILTVHVNHHLLRGETHIPVAHQAADPAIALLGLAKFA